MNSGGLARRTAAIVVLGIGLFCAAVTLPAAIMGVNQTIENSKQIAAEFQKAATVVEVYRERHGHLPTNDEFSAWSDRQPEKRGPYFIVKPGEDEFGEEAVRQLGRPKGGYFIGMFRGEWMEYYEPSGGGTTLTLDESEYYVFGSRTFDLVFGGLLTLVILGISTGLWIGKLPRKWTLRPTG